MNENYKISKEGQNLDIVDKEISKKIFQNIFENLNDLVFILNKNFEIEYTNEDILFKLMELRLNNLVGKSAFTYIHPEDEEKVKGIFEDKSNSSANISELRFKHKDGHWIWFESRGKSFFDKTGKLSICFCGIKIPHYYSIPYFFRFVNYFLQLFYLNHEKYD